jgi:hypothetical protein
MVVGDLVRVDFFLAQALPRPLAMVLSFMFCDDSSTFTNVDFPLLYTTWYRCLLFLRTSTLLLNLLRHIIGCIGNISSWHHELGISIRLQYCLNPERIQHYARPIRIGDQQTRFLLAQSYLRHFRPCHIGMPVLLSSGNFVRPRKSHSRSNRHRGQGRGANARGFRKRQGGRAKPEDETLVRGIRISLDLSHRPHIFF